MNRLLLFDVDGTLVDTAGAGRRAMLRAFRDVLKIERIETRARDVRFAGMTDWGIFEALTAAVGRPMRWGDEPMERLRESYLDCLGEEMARTDGRRRVLPGIRPLLRSLDARPDACSGLLTGNLEAGARTKLEPFGLNGHFPTGGYGSDAADRRIVARIARDRLAAHHGIEFAARQVVVIGDTIHDVDCAKANGFRAVAVAAGFHTHDRLAASRPDALLADLSDLDEALRALGC